MNFDLIGETSTSGIFQEQIVVLITILEGVVITEASNDSRART
jgi:hypothetical protein